jgi:acetyl esterase/lipase
MKVIDRELITTPAISIAAVAMLMAMAPADLPAQDPGKIANLFQDYAVTPDVVYGRATNQDLTLDLYVPGRVKGPNPAIIYFHGGGWMASSKESFVLMLIPYLEMGWTVVNVGYRLGGSAHAPAAVEDARCAFRWVVRNAEAHNIDRDRIVLSGASAGGHLALMAGLLDPSAGLDRLCPGDEPLRAAAIISWSGITDVHEQINGPGARRYAVAWMGSQPHRDELAQRLSPLTHVRPGVPPIFTVHGDDDRTVPYAQAVRLHEALARHGVVNELMKIPGGPHVGFGLENQRVVERIRAFLARLNIRKTEIPPFD